MAGEQIGPYVLLGQVDAPDGPVWKAQEAATGLVVALRLLPGDASGTTYVVQNWLTGASLGTVTAGSAAATGGAAATGAAGTAASTGAAATGAPGAAVSTGGAGLPGGSPAAGGATASTSSTATSGATGTAAHAGGGSGGAASSGVAAPGGHAAAGAKGVLGHIAAHKLVAAAAAVVIAGGVIAAAVLVAAGADDEPQRRTASDRSVAASAAPTTAGSGAPTGGSPSAPTSAASAIPTMREDEVAAAKIEGRYNATSAGGTVGGTSIPAGSGGALVLRVISDCTSGPCTVRVTDGNDSLSGTGSYDDGAWSGGGTYTASDIECTSQFDMTLTPSGRNLTLRFVSGDFCGYGAADLSWKLTPTG